jgi:hypothetical protein
VKGEVEERLPYTLHIDMDNAVWLQERVDTLNAECTCGRKHTFEGQINDMLKIQQAGSRDRGYQFGHRAPVRDWKDSEMTKTSTFALDDSGAPDGIVTTRQCRRVRVRPLTDVRWRFYGHSQNGVEVVMNTGQEAQVEPEDQAAAGAQHRDFQAGQVVAYGASMSGAGTITMIMMEDY